ncbi:MAG: DUF4830 domain-containing protein [Clostridia bacterium]|nr:DUF4830 domain-containing protein [Clostridia bacterium]
MFVFSLNGRSVKYFGAAVLVCAVLAISVVALPAYETNGTAYVSAVNNEPISFKGIKQAEDRLSFIHSFGIEVNAEPIERFATKIPSDFDSVYEEYNNIQKAQGLDLSKYKGKKVTRYTYEVTNYPKDSGGVPAQVYLNLIIYKDRVIGGDMSSPDGGGFVRTFCDFSAT